MNRLSTGITDFDHLVEGGFPENSSVLITGSPGTGKSIFGLQYLYHGAMKGENGLFISLEDSADNIKEQAHQFGWDFNALEHDGKLKIVEIPINVPDIDLIDTLKRNIAKVKARRMVVDSLSVLIFNSYHFKLPIGIPNDTKDVTVSDDGSINISKTAVREDTSFIHDFVTGVKGLGITSLLITDSDDGKSLTKDGVSEFITDGLIRVGMKDFGKTIVRTLEILKMRRTRIVPGIKTLEFGKHGLELKEFTY